MTILLTVGGFLLLYGLITLLFYGSFYFCRPSFIARLPKEFNEDQLNSSRADAYFRRGNFFQHKGMFETAIDNYNKSMGLDSSHPLAQKHHKYAMLKKIVPSFSFEDDQEIDDNNELFSPLEGGLSRENSTEEDYYIEEIQDIEISSVDSSDTETSIAGSNNLKEDESYIDLSVENITESTETPAPQELTISMESIDQEPTDTSTDSTPSFDDAPELIPFQLGQTFHKQGILDDAIAEYDKAIKINPEHVDSYLNRASALLKLSRISDAVIDLDKIIELEPNHIKARIKRGNIFLHQSKLDEAIDDYTVAINLPHCSAKHLIRRGTAFFRKKLFEEAIDDFTKAIALEPANKEAITSRGLAFKQAGHIDQAKKDFEKVENLKQDEVEISIPDPSIQQEDQISTLPPNLAKVFKDGMKELHNQNESKALAAFDKIIQEAPDHPDSFYQKANIHFANKKYDSAIADYNMAIEKNPSFGEAYCKRGEANIQANLYIDAISDFDRAIELMPQSIEAYLNRGKANSQRAQRDQAIADFSKILEIDGDSNTAYYLRGIEWQSLGEYDKALTDLDKACNLGNNAACVAYLNIQKPQ